MKHTFFAGLAAIGMLAVLPETGRAHGGIYRGPGDIVPPQPGGGGGRSPAGPSGPKAPSPTTPNPAAPVGPAPSGSPTGGPNPPAGAGGSAPRTGRRGADLTDDFTTWDYWWEFNKDRYLGLKDAIGAATPVTDSDEQYLGPTRRVDSRDSLRPTANERRDGIQAALLRAITGTDDQDIATACMVAMAKVGLEPHGGHLADVFAAHLQSHNQEVRETAALAFGIAANPDATALDTLADLVADNTKGRARCALARVDDRTRAFATYGLGLIAHANADVMLKRQVFQSLQPVLAEGTAGDRNRSVAAIHAIGLLNLDARDPRSAALLTDALQCLEHYYLLPLGTGEQLLQAHVPTAVARLLRADHPDRGVVIHWQELLLADLDDRADRKPTRRSNDLARSSALALGQLCRPCDDPATGDGAICARLLAVANGHRDAQTRYFALMALGQIGGTWCRSALLEAFRKANRSIEKPWVAMALGVLAYARQHAADVDPITAPDGEISRSLLPELTSQRDPMTQAGIAIALGLAGCREAAAPMRTLLAASRSKDDLAGYLCIALALLQDDLARDPIREVLLQSTRRPGLCQQAAIALGRLGDKGTAQLLQDQLLTDPGGNLARLSAIAGGLGHIGDRRSIAPLCQVLGDDNLRGLVRAFAAVALGGVGDKGRLPWSSAIGANLNYRAAVETLTDHVGGILDIL